MRSVRDHIARLQALRSALPAIAETVARVSAESAVAVVKNRSIQEGIDRDGRPGNKAKYSDKRVPSYWLQGKELNQAGRDYLKQNALANWYGLRQAQGLPSDKVNLSYSNQMWKQYGVIRVTVRGAGFVAEVGISGSRSDVFEQNEKQYGQFWKPLPDELDQISQDRRREFFDFISRYL